MVKPRTRKLIFQNHVDEHLLITLISFAASVSLTRLFLEMTGYPQIGGGELHIAHVLWGGLLLFIGALVSIIFSNHWAKDLSALFSGIGIGLFIDEIGKFITQSNDYFYPSAAPLIYAFFLLTVFLYIEIRRPREKNARAFLYNAFNDLEELLDNDLSIKEHRKLVNKLELAIIYSEEPQLTDLAKTLLAYLKRRELELVPHQPDFIENLKLQYKIFEIKFFKRNRMRLIIAAFLIISGIFTLFEPLVFLSSFDNPAVIEQIFFDLFNQRLVKNASGITWFQAQIILEGLIGLVSTLSGILLIIKREILGVRIAIFTMLFTLTTANLLMFYFDQFSTIANAIVQFIILLMLIRYRIRFFTTTRRFSRR